MKMEVIPKGKVTTLKRFLFLFFLPSVPRSLPPPLLPFLLSSFLSIFGGYPQPSSVIGMGKAV